MRGAISRCDRCAHLTMAFSSSSFRSFFVAGMPMRSAKFFNCSRYSQSAQATERAGKPTLHLPLHRPVNYVAQAS
jgi:hypothetical protein